MIIDGRWTGGGRAFRRRQVNQGLLLLTAASTTMKPVADDRVTGGIRSIRLIATSVRTREMSQKTLSFLRGDFRHVMKKCSHVRAALLIASFIVLLNCFQMSIALLDEIDAHLQDFRFFQLLKTSFLKRKEKRDEWIDEGFSSYIAMNGEQIFQFIETSIDPIASFLLHVGFGNLNEGGSVTNVTSVCFAYLARTCWSIEFFHVNIASTCVEHGDG